MAADSNPPARPSDLSLDRWGAFGHAAFTAIWTASAVSNLGAAVFDTASGWMITSLNANPIAVSLVQVAVSLPLFLFTMPAGALADVINPKRLLVTVEIAIIVIGVAFAFLATFDLASTGT
ncbi:MAG TPA: MFS transporter, partial [Roseiarcus sp.]|nr:MFS transporter [Roseiarcus sp.]